MSPRSVLASPLTSVTRGRLGQLEAQEPGRPASRSTRSSRRPCCPAGSGRRGGRGVVDDPGVDVGLGDRCAAVAVHVVEAPGASVVTGQVTAPAIGSFTASVVIVVVPVFLTRSDQVILSPRSVLPSPLTSVTAADLVSCRRRASGDRGVGRRRVRRTVVPAGSVADGGRRVGDDAGVDVGLA